MAGGSASILIDGPRGPSFLNESATFTGEDRGSISFDGSVFSFSGVKEISDTARSRSLGLDLSPVDPETVRVGRAEFLTSSVMVQASRGDTALARYGFGSKTNLGLKLGPADSRIFVDSRYIYSETTITIDGGDGYDSLVFDGGAGEVEIARGLEPNQIVLARRFAGKLILNNVEVVPVVNDRVEGYAVQPFEAIVGRLLLDFDLGLFRTPALQSLSDPVRLGATPEAFAATIS